MNQRIVAKLAGVSSATVSRVINGDPRVSPETAERVRKTILECGYVQNAVARNLKKASTNIIGYIVPDIRNPFFPLVLAGIEHVCWEKGYDIILQNTDESAEKEKRAINALLRSRVDGVIGDFVDPNSDDVKMIEKMGVPLVLLDRKPIKNEKANYVIVDNIGGTSQLMEYLIGLGHKKIAIIHGPTTNTPGIDRLEAYYASMRKAKIEVNKDFVLDGSFSEEGGYKCTCKLLSLKNRPTAIFAANMTMAIGAFKALADHGVKIPEDISLAGFDDFTLAAYLNPPITVVNRPTWEMGMVAANMLLESIQNRNERKEETEKGVVLPTNLILRKSCSFCKGEMV